MADVRDKYEILENFIKPMGYTIDGISQGYTHQIFFRHILKNYELKVDLNDKNFDVDLHHNRYTHKQTLELMDDLHFMKVLAEYTLELFKELRYEETRNYKTI